MNYFIYTDSESAGKLRNSIQPGIAIPFSKSEIQRYVITHCAPTSIVLAERRHNEAGRLTDFFEEVRQREEYRYWLFGHYHDNRMIDDKHILLWEQIVQIL